MPTEAEVEQITERVRSEATDGDAVRVLPLWYKDARVGLYDLPMILTQELEENLDLPFVSTLYVPYVHAFDSGLEQTTAHLSDVETLLDLEHISLLRGQPELEFRALWDATHAIRDANVEAVKGPNRRETCDRWTQDAYHCGSFNRWLHVGVRSRDVGDDPRTCIIANPRPHPEAWSISWENVPLGDRLRIRYGYTMWALRATRGGELRFNVYVNGEEVHAASLQINDAEYAYVDVPMANVEATEGTVEVRIEADDHFDRFFCFRLQTTEQAQGE
jgi:hypothetical protein